MNIVEEKDDHVNKGRGSSEAEGEESSQLDNAEAAEDDDLSNENIHSYSNLLPMIKDLKGNNYCVSYLYLNEVAVGLLLRSQRIRAVFLKALRGSTGVRDVHIHPNYWYYEPDPDEPDPEDFLDDLPNEIPTEGELEACTDLGRVLGALPSLESLKFGCNNAAELSVAARVLEHTKQIQSLEFNVEGHISSENFQAVAESLRDHPSIREGHIGGNRSGSFSVVCQGFLVLPKLETVKLIGDPFEGKGTMSISNREDMEAVGDLMRLESVQDFELYNLSFENAGAFGVICDAISSSTLQSLNLDQFDFLEDGQTALGGAVINSKLAKFSFDPACESLTDTYQSLYTVLGAGLPANDTLRELRLYCWASPERDNGMRELLQGVGENRHLQTVRLPSCEWTDDWGQHLGQCISQCTLKTLSAPAHSQHAIADQAVLEIGKGLTTNKSLTTFDVGLHHSKMSRDGLLQLFKAFLPNNSCLRSFKVGQVLGEGNPTQKYLDNLLAAAKTNFTLEEFCAEGDKHNLPLLCHVRCILRLNKAGRSYMRDDPPSREKGVKVLEAVRDDLACLFLHLQENPSLCDRAKLTRANASGRKRKAEES